MTIPDHLITPLDWSAEALRHAAAWTGQPEGARALVESKRYLAMHEQIERLRGHLEQAQQQAQAELDKRATALDDRLAPAAATAPADLVAAERERCARLCDRRAFTMHETRRHEAQTLAALIRGEYGDCGDTSTRVYVDAGEDHLDPLIARPAPASAPERAEPRFAPCGRSAGTCGRSTHGCGRRECQADTAAPERAEQAAAKRAVRAAVAAIYFADNSDYLSALWDVVRALRPDLEDMLARDERAAFEAVQDEPSQAEPCRCPHAADHRHACTGSCGPDGCSDRVACPKGGAA